jgi:hypothetical protein
VIDARPPEPGSPLLFRPGAISEPREAAQGEGVHPEQLRRELVLHVAAHPLHDGDDGDEEHDTDRHAEQCEEALELLHANLREGEPDRFYEGHD